MSRLLPRRPGENPAPGDVRFSLRRSDLAQLGQLPGDVRARVVLLLLGVLQGEGILLGCRRVEGGRVQLEIRYPPPAPHYWPRIRPYYRRFDLERFETFDGSTASGWQGLAFLSLFPMFPG